ncbi:hypothetical protein K3495_g1283 [Podosphaera aphanis]|nr:hypothetical protein K3495_g1283 [Podosphaera aphanis]
MDEIGFLTGWGRAAKVVRRRGRGDLKNLVAGNREWCSLIESVSVDGRSIPSFVILQEGQSIQETEHDAWVKSLDNGAYIGLSQDGWSDTDLGLEWLKHFEKYSRREGAYKTARPSAELSQIDGTVHHQHADENQNWYRLLIMDGHMSHLNVKFIEFCSEHKIIPFCLPPRLSHLLQPLSQGIFNHLRTTYIETIDEYMANTVKVIERSSFIDIIAKIRPYLVCEDRVRSAFHLAGLSPLDRQIDSPEPPESPGSLKSLESLRSPIPKSFDLLDLDISAAIATLLGDNPSDTQRVGAQDFMNKLQLLQESYEVRSRHCDERLQSMRDKIDAFEGDYRLLRYQNRVLQDTNKELRENLIAGSAKNAELSSQFPK